MNFVTALRFVHEHNDMVLAVLIALFLLTSILLLLRSIGKRAGTAHAGAGGAPIDQDALETVLRKVMGDRPVSAPVAPARHVEVPPVDVNAASSRELAEAIAEREKQIEVLQIAVKEARDQASQAIADAPSISGGESGAETALKSRVDELEAKLSEYEIITDDIADLSLFKDENSRMKVELEEMRSKLDAAISEAAAARNAAPAADAATNLVSRISSEEESELKFEKAEKFELDINDDVMKAFAEAVDSGKIEKAPGAYSLPPSEVEPEVRQALEDNLASASAAANPAETVDPQAAIDAMLAAASEPSTEPVPVDPQAAIDAMLAASETAIEASPADPQAAIDAMLAAVSDSSNETVATDPQAAADALFVAASEQAAESAPAELDPQAMIDQMLKQAEDVMPAAKEITPRETQVNEMETLSPDALKMISEVEKLSDQAIEVAGEAGADALLEQLDTDKLLSEASNLSTDDSLESSAKDDLFAEFKDEKGNES